MLAADTRIEGYRILSVLGSGGFGVTYLAIDENLNKQVAIKELLPGHLVYRDGKTVRPKTEKLKEEFSVLRQRFIEEARMAASINHPNVVQILRFFPQNGTAYMVMAYEDGEELGDYLDARSEPPDPVEAGRLMSALLDGLAAVHRSGMIHRDIKPENIFVRHRDGSPVILDFGSARAADSTRFTRMLSPGYAPYEQYVESAPQGAWSDVYSLAAVFYRIIMGQKPPLATSRMLGDSLVPVVQVAKGRYPEPMLRAIDWGLAVNAAQRPQTVAAFAEAIQSALITETPQAPPSHPLPDAVIAKQISRSRNAIGRHPVMNGDIFWTLSIFSLSLANFIIGFIMLRRHGRDLLAITPIPAEADEERHDLEHLVNRPPLVFGMALLFFMAGIAMVFAGIALPQISYRTHGPLSRNFSLFYDDPLLFIGLVCFCSGMIVLTYWLWENCRTVFEYRLKLSGMKPNEKEPPDEDDEAPTGPAFFRRRIGNVMELGMLAATVCYMDYIAINHAIMSTMVGIVASNLIIILVVLTLGLAFIMTVCLFSLWAYLGKDMLTYALFERQSHWRWRFTANVSRVLLIITFFAIPSLTNFDVYRDVLQLLFR
ncbi:MAG: serine/threonine-protein kinase [Rhodospirillaceae bacterium]